MLRTNHCYSVRLALGLVATKIVQRSPEELTVYILRVRAEQCTAPSSDASRRICGRPYASAHLDRVRHAMEAFAAVEGRRADRNGESVGAVCLGSDRDVPATHFLLAAVGLAGPSASAKLRKTRCSTRSMCRGQQDNARSSCALIDRWTQSLWLTHRRNTWFNLLIDSIRMGAWSSKQLAEWLLNVPKRRVGQRYCGRPSHGAPSPKGMRNTARRNPASIVPRCSPPSGLPKSTS